MAVNIRYAKKSICSTKYEINVVDRLYSLT